MQLETSTTGRDTRYRKIMALSNAVFVNALLRELAQVARRQRAKQRLIG